MALETSERKFDGSGVRHLGQRDEGYPTLPSVCPDCHLVWTSAVIRKNFSENSRDVKKAFKKEKYDYKLEDSITNKESKIIIVDIKK